MFNFNKISVLIKVAQHQTVGMVRSVSLLGVILFIVLSVQCVSGVMLAFSLVTETMLIPISRNFEDQENMYTDDFFWLHERGVDLIFILLVAHVLRKLYLNSFYYLQDSAWKTGMLLFLLMHGIIFFGLVLCCTHLSDITLKIAANVVNTLTYKTGTFGYWLFTDRNLNTDTLLRLVYLHYLLPFASLAIGLNHMVDMHYNYRDGNAFRLTRVRVYWFEEFLKTEVSVAAAFLGLFYLVGASYYDKTEPLSFELFMWGDVGLMTDVRFLGVAPHWYFRTYMSWLILCPHHYFGIFGLLYLMVVMYFQPQISRTYQNLKRTGSVLYRVERSFVFNWLFCMFIVSLGYTLTYLPYGRFFTELKGNVASLCAFFYVFIYLSFPWYYLILFRASIARNWIWRVSTATAIC